jgi:hypothetical protein
MSMSPRRPVDPVDDRTEAPAAPASPSRRRFVRNAGLGAAALGAGAATGTALTGVASAQTATTEPPQLSASDVGMVQFLQSLLLAAAASLAAAAEVPGIASVIAEELRGFSRNSTTQAGAFGALLPKASVVTTPNPKLLAQGTAPATTQQQVLQLQLQLVEQLDATLLQQLGQVQAWQVAAVISSVLPIVSQEFAALNTALGNSINQWLPPFGSVTGALTPAAYPVS